MMSDGIFTPYSTYGVCARIGHGVGYGFFACDKNGNPISDYIIEITCGEATKRLKEGLGMFTGPYSWHNEAFDNKDSRFSDSRGSDLLKFLNSKSKSSALWSEIKNKAKSSVLSKIINIYKNLKLTEEANNDPMMICRLDVSPMDYEGYEGYEGYDKAEKLNTVTVFYKKLKLLPQLNTPLK